MKTISRLENGRAAFAYNCAEEGAKLEKKKEYKSYVKKIPMLIKTNGLGATAAFIFSKRKKEQQDKDPYSVIYKQIKRWFEDERNPFSEWFKDEQYKDKEFVEIVCRMESQQYKAVTKEVLAFLNWLRRFADGLIEGDE